MSAVARFLRHEYAVIKGVAHELEHNPTKQWVYHRRMTWFWLFMFGPINILGWAAAHGWWLGAITWANFLLILNLNFSNYANFATEFDAVGATDAARRLDAKASGS